MNGFQILLDVRAFSCCVFARLTVLLVLLVALGCGKGEYDRRLDQRTQELRTPAAVVDDEDDATAEDVLDDKAKDAEEEEEDYEDEDEDEEPAEEDDEDDEDEEDLDDEDA